MSGVNAILAWCIAALVMALTAFSLFVMYRMAVAW